MTPPTATMTAEPTGAPTAAPTAATPADRAALAAGLRRGAVIAVSLQLVATVAIAAWAASAQGSHEAISALFGGGFGALNVVALTWVTARLVLGGMQTYSGSMVIIGVKSVGLLGAVMATVLLFEPALVPFLVAFSASLPIIVVVCIRRFNAA